MGKRIPNSHWLVDVLVTRRCEVPWRCNECDLGGLKLALHGAVQKCIGLEMNRVLNRLKVFNNEYI